MPRAPDTDLLIWLTEEGLAGRVGHPLLEGFCQRARAAGVPLMRAILFIDTLHPLIEGSGVRWTRDPSDDSRTFDYGASDSGEALASWQRSPFHQLELSGETTLRLPLGGPQPSRFPMAARFEAEGATEYVAFLHRATPDGLAGLDCIYSHWVTDAPGGFSAAALDFLAATVPTLALVQRGAAIAEIPRTLAHTYLGRDAGERVLAGRIARGVADRISTALWFSDLRSFTTITDRADPADTIPFLNDYAEAAIGAVQAAGGDVLKLIGDGLLAIFRADDDVATAARAALSAERDFRTRLAQLNAERTTRGAATTTAYVGLHVGEVFFGNIGAPDRLDFTVVGPAVNEVSRIASLCRSVDRDLLISEALADCLAPEVRTALVSTGRFALRGVRRAQDLFTLDPEIASDPARAALFATALVADPADS